MKKAILVLILILSQSGFGQEKAEVKPFLPDLLMQFPNVRDFTISSGGDEAWCTAQSPLGEISVILSLKKKNGIWSQPQIASFSGTHKDLEPFLSPDGLKLYFVSDRPLTNATKEPKDFDIWYVQRTSTDAAWSEPVNMGSPVNSEHNEFYPAVAANNNLYFTSDAPASKGKDDIFWSAWKNGRYTTPVPLSEAVNSEGYEYNAWIAPDESILIFGGYNRKDGLGSGDLYISYKNTDGTWSQAKNLGKGINSKHMDYCPFVAPNTSTLYFTSRRSRLKPNSSGFGTVRELLTEITTYENGFSRVYTTSIEQLLSGAKK